MRAKAIVTVILLCTVELSGFACGGDSSPVQGNIAFVSNRDGNWEVYAMGADGSNETNLTNNQLRLSTPRGRPSVRIRPGERRNSFLAFGLLR